MRTEQGATALRVALAVVVSILGTVALFIVILFAATHAWPISAGVVSVNFVSAGVVSVGLVSAGIVSVGLVSVGLVNISVLSLGGFAVLAVVAIAQRHLRLTVVPNRALVRVPHGASDADAEREPLLAAPTAQDFFYPVQQPPPQQQQQWEAPPPQAQWHGNGTRSWVSRQYAPSLAHSLHKLQPVMRGSMNTNRYPPSGYA